MATTTMQRILTRLCRAGWVSRLARGQRDDLVVAAADVGDGRAAEELTAIAEVWRRVADRLEEGAPLEAGVYAQVAADVEARAVVLRGVPKIRTLLASRPDLDVAPADVALDKLAAVAEVALQLRSRPAAATVRALLAWCLVLREGQVDVVLGPDSVQLVVAGILHECVVSVRARVVGDHPVVAEFVRDLRERHPRGAATVGSAHLRHLADTLAAPLPAPESAMRATITMTNRT
ncbi:hypothetical protein [Amycolatopsis saalfeldensis]|nr:hypothetical protein [Amycolatopsis saalfeldensis]